MFGGNAGFLYNNKKQKVDFKKKDSTIATKTL